MNKQLNDKMSNANNRQPLEEDKTTQNDFLKKSVDNEVNQEIIDDIDVSPNFVSEDGYREEVVPPDNMEQKMELENSPLQDEFSNEPTMKQGHKENKGI